MSEGESSVRAGPNCVDIGPIGFALSPPIQDRGGGGVGIATQRFRSSRSKVCASSLARSLSHRLGENANTRSAGLKGSRPSLIMHCQVSRERRSYSSPLVCAEPERARASALPSFRFPTYISRSSLCPLA